MSQLRSLLFVFCMFFCLGCNNHQKETEDSALKNIHIDLTKTENKKPLEEYVDEVEFIRLETTDSSLIRMITGIKVADRKIYISDQSQGCIFVFDENGKYLFKLEHLGRGPDEYSHLLGFYVDKQHIIVSGMLELVLYDKDNGSFAKKIRIDPKDFVPEKFYVDSTFYYFLTGDGFSASKMQATVLVFDKEEFAFRKGYVDPFYFKERFHVTSTVFIPSPYGLLFHQVLNDTLYRLGEQGLEPLFFLNAGKRQFTYEMYEKAPVDFKGEKVIPYKTVYQIDNIVCMDNYLSFTCCQKRNNNEYDAFYCFYSLDNGTLKVIDENKFKEKNKYGVNFFHYNAIDKDGYFYAVCYPSLITYFRDKKGDQLDERYNEMQVDDNPWLLKYRLKI